MKDLQRFFKNIFNIKINCTGNFALLYTILTILKLEFWMYNIEIVNMVLSKLFECLISPYLLLKTIRSLKCWLIEIKLTSNSELMFSYNNCKLNYIKTTENSFSLYFTQWFFCVELLNMTEPVRRLIYCIVQNSNRTPSHVLKLIIHLSLYCQNSTVGAYHSNWYFWTRCSRNTETGLNCPNPKTQKKNAHHMHIRLFLRLRFSRPSPKS